MERRIEREIEGTKKKKIREGRLRKKATGKGEDSL